MMKLRQIGLGGLLGLTTLSAQGAIPIQGRITDDTAIYQNLSEIQVARQAELSFDSDIHRLAALEPQYRERLQSLSEHPRLRKPMHRIMKRKYQRGR